MKIKVLPLLLLLPFFAFSQTAEEKRKLASFSNKEANAVLAKELQKEEQQRKLRLDAYLKSNPQISKVETTDDGFGKKELMDVLPNGEKIYAQTHNAGSAITARANSLYSGGSLGINIQGQGMTAGVWDGGSVLDTHVEFNVNGISKIQNMDGSMPEDHATHVGGTIAAMGINPNVRGLAFNSSLKSYDWNNDLFEMQSEAISGLLMSNHSYGMGSLQSIWFFGAYDNRARQIDLLSNANPYYLPVFSAGNSRNLTTAPASTQINNKFGYDLIYGHANAKNILTVAAVGQVSNYFDPSSVTMSAFSSYGPSDDGRIKPDISMKGVQVLSTLSTSNTSIGSLSGTSMASPGITGVIALLQQYHNQLYGTWMRAASVKGLMLHTADEAGDDAGPDYKFGWGLVNATESAKAIRDKNKASNGSIILENTLSAGQTFSKTISANGLNPLRVSISWNDPAHPSPNTGTVDPAIKYLVNDLDVKVTGVDGTIYYPWKLQGMSTPWDPATNNSPNQTDNFERVDIQNPLGIYTINVTHNGNLTGGSQNYTLIVTSDALSSLGTADSEFSNINVSIYPNPVSEKLYIKGLEFNTAYISITDTTGRLVKKETLKEPSIDLHNLSSGVYVVNINTDSGFQTSLKFIKK